MSFGTLLLLLMFDLLLMANDSGILFYINRSRDADKVYYAVNAKPGGMLDIKKPVEVFWIRHTENGQREPLTLIQERLAYGVEYEKVHGNYAKFHMAGYPKVSFVITKKDGKYHAFVSIDGEFIRVKELYIKFENESFLSPEISRIELHGYDSLNKPVVKYFYE